MEPHWGVKGRTNVIGSLLGIFLLNVSLFQTTINSAVLNMWVEQNLIPKFPAKPVVIMDHAAFHKGKEM